MSESKQQKDLQSTSRLLWRPFSLRFDDDTLECMYHEECRLTWNVTDAIAHSLAIAVGPGLCFSLKDVLPWWYLILWLTFSFVLAPMHVYAFFKNREFFDRHRLKSVLFFRLGNIMAFSGFGFYLKAPGADIGTVMSTILTKAGIPNMFFTALMHRVQFRSHMIIHSLALLQTLIWILPFCQTCSSDTSVMSIFQTIGSGIDGAFALALLGKRPDIKTYPCWMISSAVIILVAYIIPTFLVFVAEVVSRVVFLQRMVSKDVNEIIKAYGHDALRVATLGFVTAVVLLWFILSLIRDQQQ